MRVFYLWYVNRLYNIWSSIASSYFIAPVPGPPKEPNAASALDWAKPPQAKCRCGCGYHPTAIPQWLGRRWLSSIILLFANGSGISEKLFCKWFPGFRTLISRKESRTENSPTAPRELPDSSPTAPRKTPRQLPESTTTTPDNFPGTFPQTAWKSLQICAASVFWPTGNVSMSGVSPLAYLSLSLQSIAHSRSRWLIASVHSSLAHLYTFIAPMHVTLGASSAGDPQRCNQFAIGFSICLRSSGAMGSLLTAARPPTSEDGRPASITNQRKSIPKHSFSKGMHGTASHNCFRVWLGMTSVSQHSMFQTKPCL